MARVKTYEAMVLLDNREVKKGWPNLKELVDGVFKKVGAEIVVSKRWDERKLAYEIKKQRRATYYLAYFKSDPEQITELNRNLRLTAPVLRHLVLTCEEVPPEAYEPEREFDLDNPDRSDDESDGESSEGEESSEAAEGAESSDSEGSGEGAESSESGGDSSESAASGGDDAEASASEDSGGEQDSESKES